MSKQLNWFPKANITLKTIDFTGYSGKFFLFGNY